MMDLEPYERFVADELAHRGRRVLSVHIARDIACPEYLHLIACCLGDPKAGTTLVRGDLTSGWLRDWVRANWDQGVKV